MIRGECPYCFKRLRVKDADVGKVLLCPKCRSKFRIPPVRVDAELAPSPRRKSAPESEKTCTEPEVSACKEVEEDESPSPQEDEVERLPPRRRGKKRPKRQKGLQAWWAGLPDIVHYSSTVILPLLFLGVVALLVLGLCKLCPPLCVPVLLMGCLIVFVADTWLLFLAYQEGGVLGVLYANLLRPIYVLTHFDEVKRPFFIGLIGCVLALVAALSASPGQLSSRMTLDSRPREPLVASAAAPRPPLRTNAFFPFFRSPSPAGRIIL